MKFRLPVLLVLLSFSWLQGCYVTRSIVRNLPGHQDYKFMPFRRLQPAPVPFHFFQKDNAEIGAIKLREWYYLISLDELIAKQQPAAFLIIHKDTILYERYFGKFDAQFLFNSFSVTKSFVNSLVGIAIEEGKIPSIESKLTEMLPELENYPQFQGIEVKHLLDMTSGLEARWNVLNPFDHLARSYYGNDLRKLVLGIKKVYSPGEVFQYNNLNTVLLAMILEKRTGMTVTQYLQEKIWNPLGMESGGLWLTDNQGSTGIEKAFCCLHATARDFAKYGRLYLNHGNWNGKQIIPCAWIDRILNLESKQWDYQMHTAILDTEPLTYAFRGLYNQNIFINPSRELVVVTMNPAKRKDNPLLWENIFKQISLVLNKK